MNWKELYAGKVNRSEVQQAVQDEEWQALRVYMKGKSLWMKYILLRNWLEKNKHSSKSKLQVTNYITALSRGGLIQVEDYKEEKGLAVHR